jgi:hypothetical protein
MTSLMTIELQIPPQPPYFRSCFSSADLAVTMGLVDMLQTAIPDDPNVATGFDLWLHQAICPIADIAEGVRETFNEV